jgi:DNA-binding NtrC family response regulator
MNRSSASYELVRAYAPKSGATARVVRASLGARKLAREITELSVLATPVLIVGETGTGKTLVAQELRDGREAGTATFGSRAEPGASTTVNCASLSEAQLAQFVLEDLKEEASPSSTLFLDEVGELSPWGQAVLLRALSDRDPSRGPRLLSATSRDLEAMVRAGTFSGELLMRLRGVTLQLPPLRERLDEIGPLALHFVRLALMSTRTQVVSMDPRVVAALEHHAWPGNVRELRNTISAALALCSDGYLCIEGLPEELRIAYAASARD